MENEEAKKKRSIISVIGRIVLLLSIIVGFLAAMIFFVIPNVLSFFWGKDIPPVDDSALQLQNVDISQGKNSVYDLNKLNGIVTSDLDLPEGVTTLKYLESDKWDQVVVESLIDDNKQALQYFSDAARKEKFQAEVPEGFMMMPMNNWRATSRLSGTKAIWLAKNGRSEEAIDEAFKSIIIGDTIARSQCDLFIWLVGTGIERTGLDTLQKVVSMVPPGAVDFLKYQAKLEKYKGGKNEAPFKGEYLSAKESWSEIAQLGGSHVKPFYKNNFYFKPNLTNSYFFDFYSKLISESRKECSDIKEVALTDFKIESSNFVKMYFTENAIGKLLIGLPQMALNNTLQKRCETEKKFEDAMLLLNSKK